MLEAFSLVGYEAVRDRPLNTKDLLDNRSLVRLTIHVQHTTGAAFGQWLVMHRGVESKRAKEKEKAWGVMLGVFVDGF
jgi:hypothetical protein